MKRHKRFLLFIIVGLFVVSSLLFFSTPVNAATNKLVHVRHERSIDYPVDIWGTFDFSSVGIDNLNLIATYCNGPGCVPTFQQQTYLYSSSDFNNDFYEYITFSGTNSYLEIIYNSTLKKFFYNLYDYYYTSWDSTHAQFDVYMVVPYSYDLAGLDEVFPGLSYTILDIQDYDLGTKVINFSSVPALITGVVSNNWLYIIVISGVVLFSGFLMRLVKRFNF